MALRLLGDGERRYPLPHELLSFGREHCQVADPSSRVAALVSAMGETLKEARKDDRVPRPLLKAMTLEWGESLRLA